MDAIICIGLSRRNTVFINKCVSLLDPCRLECIVDLRRNFANIWNIKFTVV